MSFNILGADTSTWPDRRNGISDKIIESDADIIGLQEALSTPREDLANDLRNSYDLIEFNIPSRYGNPVMIRKDHFNLLRQGSVHTASCGSDRYTNWLLLRENDSGRELYFYNDHFCVSSSTKEEHAIILAETMYEHQRNRYRPAISVGDFNSSRNSAVMRYLLDRVPIDSTPNLVALTDTWEAVHPTIEKPPTHERGASIDWILAIRGVTVTDAVVGDSEGFSDHNPLTATFNL